MTDHALKRTLVLHHDDLGGSHGANLAFLDLFDRGIVTSGTVMVPCPWFPEIAAIARERPDLDLGIHLTLNAEWEGFRWRPLTGVSANGLTDAEGYFWRRVEDTRRHADPRAVEAELRAQIETGLAAGIDATHLDAHMGCAWQPEFIEIFERLGAEYRLPIALTQDVGRMAPAGTDYGPVFRRLEQRGNPRFEAYIVTAFGNLQPDEATYAAILDGCKPGLNWSAFHFTAPGDFEPMSDDAPTRFAEYALFRSERIETMLAEAGIELVGMRGFRDAMRTG
jgi:chitin disaccharide deacetylase